MHGPVDPQCTRHVPWHVTSQLPVDVHVTTLWSPTVGAQSLTLVHVYTHPAPQVAPHVLVLSQDTLHSSPHETLQLGPLEQANEQWSAQVALQSLPKLEHVGEHGEAEPQSSVHAPPPWHPHELPVHSGSAGDDEHATARTTSSDIVPDHAAAARFVTRAFMMPCILPAS